MSKLIDTNLHGVQVLRVLERFNFSDAPAVWFEPGSYVIAPTEHASKAVAAGAAVAVDAAAPRAHRAIAR